MPTFGDQYVGAAESFTVNGVDQIPNVDTALKQLDVDSSPVITLLAQMPQHIETVTNPTFQWMEIQYDEPDVVCQTAIAAQGANTTQSVVITTLAVVSGDGFSEPTSGQNFEVRSVTSQNVGATTSTVVIAKTPTSSGTTAVAANSMFIRLSNHLAEGTWFPQAKSKKPLRKTNIIMHTAAQIEVSNLQMYMGMYYGPEWEFQKKNTIINYRRQMEREALWSQQFEELRNSTGPDGQVVQGMFRGTRGVIPSISTYVVPYAGTLTEATLDAYLGTQVWGDMYAGSDLKFGFCGPQVLIDISSFVKNKVRILNTTKQYGLAISEYIAPFGNRRLYLIEEKEFKTRAAYLNTMLTLDMDYLKLKKAGPTLITIGDSSRHGKSSRAIYMESYWGIQLEWERVHSRLTH